MYNKVNMNSGSSNAALLQHCVWSLYWAILGWMWFMVDADGFWTSCYR